MRIITDKDEIQKCQRKLEMLLKELLLNRNILKVGYPGGSEDVELFHNNEIWYTTRPPSQDMRLPRTWNAFGLGIRERGNQHITVEINTPIEGYTKRVGGLFAQDEQTNGYYLLHRGKIGGGKPGVGKGKFRDWYQAEKWVVATDDAGNRDKVIKVAPLDRENILQQLTEFIKAVAKFKESKTSSRVKSSEDSHSRLTLGTEVDVAQRLTQWRQEATDPAHPNYKHADLDHPAFTYATVSRLLQKLREAPDTFGRDDIVALFGALNSGQRMKNKVADENPLPELRRAIITLVDRIGTTTDKITEANQAIKFASHNMLGELYGWANSATAPLYNGCAIDALHYLGYTFSDKDYPAFVAAHERFKQVYQQQVGHLRPDLPLNLEIDKLYNVIDKVDLKKSGDTTPSGKQVSGIKEIYTPEPPATYDRQTFLTRTYLRSEQADDLHTLLLEKKQIILYGPPGTGKTYVAQELAKWITGLVTPSDDRVEMIQFHPAYSYEDFIEGIRPESKQVGDGRFAVDYPARPGVFRRFCKMAEENPGQAYVFIIDEINRGNIPRIFGELMLLLEYRERDVPLPYSGERFRIPTNIYLIGTMNTADRSIALVDFALRRRFHFFQFGADPDLLERWLVDHPVSIPYLAKLYRRLSEEAIDDPAYAVGFSYFMAKDLTEEKLSRIWRCSIIPYLVEYHVEQRARVENWKWKSDFMAGIRGEA